MQTFASRLRLYPAAFDRTIGAQGPSCSFAEAVGQAATNVYVRAAAAQKAREMPLYVIGRGEEMKAVGEAYRKFLLALARGEPPAELKALLQEADALLAPLLAK